MLVESRGLMAASFVASVAVHAVILALCGLVFFSPACIGPVPIASTVEIPVRFQLE
jgi:hypothetical protein